MVILPNLLKVEICLFSTPSKLRQLLLIFFYHQAYYKSLGSNFLAKDELFSKLIRNLSKQELPNFIYLFISLPFGG